MSNPIGDPIPLLSLAEFESLDAAVTLRVNGLIDGRRRDDLLNGLLTVNGPRRKITVSGSLLGEIAAQVGGALIGLFVPPSVDLYNVPEGTYVVIGGLLPMCVEPQAAAATAVLDQMSPESLMTMLTSAEVARGTRVGQVMLNGRAAEHYVIDGAQFLVAAQASDDPQLRAFADGLWSAEDADLYVDVASGYPVAYHGRFSGAFEPLKFTGQFELQTELTGVNTATPVVLPPNCEQAIKFGGGPAV